MGADHSSVPSISRISECEFSVLPDRKDGCSPSYFTKVLDPSTEYLKVSAEVSMT